MAKVGGLWLGLLKGNHSNYFQVRPLFTSARIQYGDFLHNLRRIERGGDLDLGFMAEYLFSHLPKHSQTNKAKNMVTSISTRRGIGELL